MSPLLLAGMLSLSSSPFDDFRYREPGQCDLRVVSGELARHGTLERLDRALKALAWLGSPIPGLTPPRRPDLLPGSPRPYRQGWHQGVDLYPDWRFRGSKEIRACGDGWIVRADQDYKELAPEERAGVLGRQPPDGNGDPEDLDRLHGRQVWILHEGGVLSRYSHLSRIRPSAVRGTWIAKGEPLGIMGNSGTSSGAEGGREDIHLHLEIHTPEGPFWEGLTLAQVDEVLDDLMSR